MSTENPHRTADPDAQLREELRFGAALCTSALESAELSGEESVAAAAHLVATADRTLHRLVASARDQGMSWTQIGALLGITRQAAQKRFSSPPRRVLAAADGPDPALVDLAAEVMDQAAAGGTELLDRIAGPHLAQILGEGGVAPVLAGVEPIFGRRLSRSAPEARVIARVTVVHAREHRERTDAVVRVSLTADGHLLGLHYDFAEPEQVDPDTATPEHRSR